MHETGIVGNLIRRVQQAAQQADAERIAAVVVRLDALSQFFTASFSRAFR